MSTRYHSFAKGLFFASLCFWAAACAPAGPGYLPNENLEISEETGESEEGIPQDGVELDHAPNAVDESSKDPDGQPPTSTDSASATTGFLEPGAVRALAKKVADWQIEHHEDSATYRAVAGGGSAKGKAPHHDLSWHQAALYVGMLEWSGISDDPKYSDWLVKIGERNGWQLHKRRYHADDHAVGQMYLSLYRQKNDPRMLGPTRKRFDWILQHRKTTSLKWKGGSKKCTDRWCWCDALFMAPPVWARLARITGEVKYLDFMVDEYKAAYDLLWDENEKLYYRDTRYFSRKEKNGKNVFWARGNGWAFAGLALLIPELPDDGAYRPFFVKMFQEMAASVKRTQRPDHTWSMGMLGDIDYYRQKESSGTSFFVFGLAWGMNQGILSREDYGPVVEDAWCALTECVTKEGMLGFVQPVGAGPGDSYPNRTEVYGVGAFLAAAAEVYKLAGGE